MAKAILDGINRTIASELHVVVPLYSGQPSPVLALHFKKDAAKPEKVQISEEK